MPLKLHPQNRNKRIEAKIAEINKKIRRAKNKRNKERLIAKRNSLRLDLNWGPRLLEGAFGNAYRRYRIDGIPGIRSFLIDLLKKESRTGAVRSQTTTWIRFRKDRELVELAFNSRMTNVYNLSDMDEIVNENDSPYERTNRKSSTIKIVDSYSTRSCSQMSISIN